MYETQNIHLLDLGFKESLPKILTSRMILTADKFGYLHLLNGDWIDHKRKVKKKKCWCGTVSFLQSCFDSILFWGFKIQFGLGKCACPVTFESSTDSPLESNKLYKNWRKIKKYDNPELQDLVWVNGSFSSPTSQCLDLLKMWFRSSKVNAKWHSKSLPDVEP